MTDKEILLAMLDKAKIGYEASFHEGMPRRIPTSDHAQLPEGWTSVDVPGRGFGDQPIDGGYGGFFAEVVFDAEGNLLAWWGWE